jgi:hypothetical protein
VHDAKVIRIEDSFEELKTPLIPQHLAEAWRKAATSVAEKFRALWNARTEQKRCLLLLDNVDELLDQEIGTWLVQLMPELSGTTVVLTARPGDVLQAGLPDSVRQKVRAIVNFDETTVNEWLANAVGPEEVASVVSKKIYNISKGHPATLALIHELLWKSGLTVNEREQMLDALPRQEGEAVAALVEGLVSRKDDDLMARCLRAASIPRQFDNPLLQYLVDDPQITDQDFRSVFDRLAGSSFVEDLSSDHSRLRLHPFVRHGLLLRMFKYEPELFKNLNDRAALYYDNQNTKVTESNYGEAFIYEDPKWQRYKREWLYHRCLASREEEKHEALLEITQIFLDAFWWWGNYIHFDFCDQLIADVNRLVEVRRAPEGRPPGDLDVILDGVDWPQLRELSKALRCILADYPLRSVKYKEAAWDKVRLAFLEVQSICGAGLKLQGLKGRDHLAALLNVFLAHTWRYQESPDIETAKDLYEQAEDQFGDEWSAPWVAYELADMLFENGADAKQVNKHWERSAKSVQSHDDVSEEPDEELTANLHRLRADLLWSQDKKEDAADAYGRAVMHAYLFHEIGENPADEYTMQFYIDIRMRAVNWLLEVNERSEPGVALPLALRMAKIWGGASESDERLEELISDGQKPLLLAHALFPRGPKASDLGKHGSPFHAEFLTKFARLRKKDIWVDLLDQ